MKLVRKDVQLHPGGLYRCCVESARQWAIAKPDEPVLEGEKVRCVYEDADATGVPRMIVKNGVLQWNPTQH